MFQLSGLRPFSISPTRIHAHRPAAGFLTQFSAQKECDDRIHHIQTAYLKRIKSKKKYLGQEKEKQLLIDSLISLNFQRRVDKNDQCVLVYIVVG